MNKNHESQLFSTPGKMRAKYLKDGVVFPIKVFDDNLFTNLNCVEKYQEFRKTVHKPWLQWLFNRIPWFVKKRIVAKVQSDIRDDKQTKSLDIMDVNQGEVERVMSQNCVNLMIHGHTHRPNTHIFELNGVKTTRIVLGDWYSQGSVLKVDSDNFDLQTRPFDTELK